MLRGVHSLAGIDCRYPLFTVAPEGTTKPGHCLLTFSTGAFVAGAPVLPVLFKYRFRQAPLPRWHMHGGHMYLNFIATWE